MSLTPEQVQRVAHLARIEIDEAGARALQAPLNAIFQMIEAMQVADTTGVEPMAHAQDVAQRLRADVVTESDWRDACQALAPEAESGLYLVPKVIE